MPLTQEGEGQLHHPPPPPQTSPPLYAPVVMFPRRLAPAIPLHGSTFFPQLSSRLTLLIQGPAVLGLGLCSSIVRSRVTVTRVWLSV